MRISFGSVLIAAAVALTAATPALADGPLLTPFTAGATTPPAPWHVAGLPSQTKPFTRFSIDEIDGRPTLKVEAESSYGNLVHPVKVDAGKLHLSWRWRVDQALEGVDLRTKSGDDTALKVCVSFDLPLDKVPFVERTLLRAARSKATEPVPSATVCYVWDAQLPAGTDLDNAFTHRMRYKVLESGPNKLRQWTNEKRDIAADFIELFGAESAEVPPVIAVLVGADSDNTKGHSIAHVADVVLE